MGELAPHDAPQERYCERCPTRERQLADLVETTQQAEDCQPRNTQLVRTSGVCTFVVWKLKIFVLYAQAER